MKKNNSINFWTNVSIKLIHSAYPYLTIEHEGLGSTGSSPQIDRRAVINFSHKTSNRSRKLTFGIGYTYWRMRVYIQIKAAATIRKFYGSIYRPIVNWASISVFRAGFGRFRPVSLGFVKKTHPSHVVLVCSIRPITIYR